MTNIFLSLLGISISVSFIVMVLILLTPLLNKRYAAKWKYLIWIFLALWLLLPFSGANGQSVMDVMSQLKKQTETKSQEKFGDTPPDVTVPSGQIIVRIPSQMTTPITVQSEKNDAGITLLDIVAFIWMVGSLIFVSVHFISYFHYKRQVIKKGNIIEDTQILHQMSELKCELHIRHTIQAIEYDEVESPMIIGFLKPVLVLPRQQYSPEELFFILKHELVHLKRGDVFWKLLFVTANAVHWFNPFIWIMQREAVVDMELSCDERVTKGAGYAVRKAYTETLLSILHKRCARKTVLSTQFYEGTKIMKKRFQNILLKNKKKNGIFMLFCAVVLTISLGILVGCTIATEKGDAVMDADQDEENKDTKTDADQAGTDEGNSYEVNELLSDLTINDVSIDWPCELEDIREVFELGVAYPFEGDVLCHDLYLDGDRVGQVYINEDTSAVLALGLSYFTLNDGAEADGVAVAFSGATEKSSYSDVVRLLGQPTRQSEREYLYIYYYDVGQQKAEDYQYDAISISFKDDSIRSIEFYTRDFLKEW